MNTTERDLTGALFVPVLSPVEHWVIRLIDFCHTFTNAYVCVQPLLKYMYM